MDLKAAAQRLKFGSLQEVAGRATVADLVPARRRTGLYLLGFRTGEAYAGLSIDIAARYVQHARTHSDIVAFAMKSIPRRQLDVEETRVVERLEGWGFRLRNIAKASAPSLQSDLDEILAVGDQNKFVRTGKLQQSSLPTPLLRDLRRRYLRRFGELMARPEGLDVATGLAVYLAHAVPIPAATQASFWSATAAVRRRLHLRVNVHWQEVLTVSSDEGPLLFSLHVARSPLAAAFGASLRAIQAGLPGARVSSHRYSPGGADQINVVVEGLDGFADLFAVTSFGTAARLFNMRLMRKGPCSWGRHHCPQLADLAGRLTYRRSI